MTRVIAKSGLQVNERTLLAPYIFSEKIVMKYINVAMILVTFKAMGYHGTR